MLSQGSGQSTRENALGENPVWPWQCESFREGNSKKNISVIFKNHGTPLQVGAENILELWGRLCRPWAKYHLLWPSEIIQKTFLKDDYFRAAVLEPKGRLDYNKQGVVIQLSSFPVLDWGSILLISVTGVIFPPTLAMCPDILSLPTLAFTSRCSSGILALLISLFSLLWQLGNNCFCMSFKVFNHFLFTYSSVN